MPKFWPFTGDEELTEFQVFPGDGFWTFRGPRGLEGGQYASRREAMAAAREARGDKREQLFYGDGSPAGERVVYRGPERIVLLRRDGSMVGELEHPLNVEVPNGG